jgi:hypothetical protein
VSRGPGKTERVIVNSIIDAHPGSILTNEFIKLAYPEDDQPKMVRWREHERHRYAVRKAIKALSQRRVEGVRLIIEGEGSEERVRADLTKWTGKKIKEPRHRDRAKP